MRITLFIEGIEFYGYHGFSSEEKTVGHRYEASLELEIESDAPSSDRLGDTVCYGTVVALVEEVSRARRHDLMEALAHSIAKAILDRHPRVREVRIELAKRLPPIPATVDRAGVSLTVTR
ncbi:MAG: dihydroneopterin aldolase [Fimbriimonadaceae bacterium]|nr:dihydroneopterin aldolase [Fimbriimonadaceae bacterium]